MTPLNFSVFSAFYFVKKHGRPKGTQSILWYKFVLKGSFKAQDVLYGRTVDFEMLVCKFYLFFISTDAAQEK